MSKKTKNLMRILPMFLAVGLIWVAMDRMGEESAEVAQSLGLVRNPEVMAAKIARKEGDPELRAERHATIEGRDKYWRELHADMPEGALMRAREQAERLPLTKMDKDGGLATWTWLGPGNIGGRVRALLIDPLDPNTMWLGGVTGGIWKTTNGGNWWNPMNDFMANLAVVSLVMTPDRQFIFASTGEGFNGGWTYPGEGVFRSGDMGNTWTQLPNPSANNFRYVTRLAVHPTIDGRIYAITHLNIAGPNDGILYRSDDDGMTWTQELVLGASGYDVKITNVTSDGTPWILVGGGNEVFLSTDDGATYTSMVTGGITTPLPATFARAEIAFGTVAGNDPVLYASINRNNGEIWRSTDGGDSWSLRNTGTNYFFGSVNQGDYDNTIWVEPGNTQRVIVGGIDLWVSTDGGTTLTKKSKWQNYDNGTSAHADHHITVPHPNYSTSNPVLFFGNDGGVQKQSDIWTNGTDTGWTNLANGLGITQFYTGAAASDGSVIMGGAQDNSFLRFNNGSSESWFQQTTGDGAYVAVKPGDPTTIYASTQNLNLLRSRDGGNTYASLKDSIPDAVNGDVAFIAPFMIDRGNANALYAGGKSLWKSVNEGTSWTSLRDSIPGFPVITTIEQATSNLNWLYVGYRDGNVGRSHNAGVNWFDIDDPSQGMVARTVTDIAVSPDSHADVIVAFSTWSGNALYRSPDSGTNWTNIGNSGINPLPDVPVNAVTFHPNNSSWIYVGTDVGVFASEDGGQNWTRTSSYPIADGPANTRVSDLVWANDNLIAATFGRGMYSTRPLVHIYVDIANAGNSGQDGSSSDPYGSVNQGELAAGHGTNITVEGGTYDEVNGLDLKKRGVIKGRNGTVIVK